MVDLEQVKEEMVKGRDSKPVRASDLLSTGSTLLNLALTGNWRGGFAKGQYFFIVGDSMSGKTFLSWTCLAEATVNRNFDDYRLVFDDVEGGSLMELERFFGKALAERVEPPSRASDGTPQYSQTIDEFYFNLDDLLHGDKPCIVVLDSMDGLSSEDELDHFQASKLAVRKGKSAPGSYGDGKAKKNSATLRQCLSEMRRNGSILIIVNQTRENLARKTMFDPKVVRSGGKALTFYNAAELWSSVKEEIKKSVRGKNRTVGTRCKVKIKKNRFAGRKWEVLIPIYYDYGIDDIESCVDFLLEEQWKTVGQKIDACGWERMEPMTKSKLIREIEEKSLEDELRLEAAKVWKEIERACSRGRKPRYS